MAHALQGLLCDRQHEHSHAEGADTKRAQLYAWQLASRVAHGCQAAIKQGEKGLPYLAYPVEERERPDPEAVW
eukprot:269474-Lingulodinium_polyedra.AAC.1